MLHSVLDDAVCDATAAQYGDYRRVQKTNKYYSLRIKIKVMYWPGSSAAIVIRYLLAVRQASYTCTFARQQLCMEHTKQHVLQACTKEAFAS